MMMSSEREQEIRKRMQQRFDARAAFFSHLIAFVIFNFMVWAFFLDIRNPLESVFGLLGVFVTGGWTIGIAIHFIVYYFAEMRERAIERELERDREFYYEKSKRRLVQLDEDGELVEDVGVQKRYNR